MTKKIELDVSGKPKGTSVKLYSIRPGKNCSHVTLLVNNRFFKCKSGKNWTSSARVVGRSRGRMPKGAMYNPKTGVIKVKF